MDAELVFDDLEERQRLSEKHSIEQHEAKCSGLGSVVLASMRQLIKTPSPAYSDLLHKMEIAHWNDVTNLIDGSALFLTMVEDLKHLVGD